jgi:GDP-L-fucose synthase
MMDRETHLLNLVAQWYRLGTCDRLAMGQNPARLLVQDIRLHMTSKLFDLRSRHVFVAGHRGMVGSAIVRRLANSACEVVTAPREQVDLLRQDATERFLFSTRPDVLIIAAEKSAVSTPLNVGTGQDITIAELADQTAKIVGYQGSIVFDTTRPDGMPRKLLDVSKLTALGWTAQTPLSTGLRQTYTSFLGGRARSH